MLSVSGTERGFNSHPLRRGNNPGKGQRGDMMRAGISRVVAQDDDGSLLFKLIACSDIIIH
jgi:hypothetical protein